MSLLKLTGKIISTIFRNHDNGYSITKILTDDEDVYTVVGYFPVLADEVLYDFFGTWITHPTYGEQFKVENVSKSNDQSINGLISYLSSSYFPGIGPKTATLIVNTFGHDCINKIIEDHTILKQINLNSSRSQNLKEQLIENQTNENMLVELYGYGFTGKLAIKLMNYYKTHTLNILKENPYQLMEDIEGIGFLRADEIAFKLKIASDDPRRIKAGIMYAIETIAYGKGDVYLSREQLQDYTKTALKIDADLEESLESLIKENKIILEENRYYLKKMFLAELSLANILKRFAKNDLSNINTSYVQTLIDMTSLQLGLEYTDKQKESIITAMTNNISIITGGPGTGKSTIINGIIEVYQKYYNVNFSDYKNFEKFALMAPTGRASKRMKEILDLEAKTIHKHLGFNYDGSYTYHKNNQMPYDLIIIDEASMIDIYLAQKLFEAIKENAKIVIVGDVDQLPSVGPGAFLFDLIESNIIKTVRLQEIHRQAKHSQIIKLAHQVNIQDVQSSDLESRQDLFLYNCYPNQIKDLIIKQVRGAIKQGYNLIFDIQILIPQYKGELGIDNVNVFLQDEFNLKNSLTMSNKKFNFYETDKVIQLINDPEKGVMNGDIGVIDKIAYNYEKKLIMTVIFDDVKVTYDSTELEDLSLAYAMSIHKSQGSEYKIVIIPLVRSFMHMLKKQLIYTAITRAKQYLVIFGDMNLLKYAANHLQENRQTTLMLRLKS